MKIVVTLRAKLAQKNKKFAEGEIASFDEAFVYKRGEYSHSTCMFPKDNKNAPKKVKQLCKEFWFIVRIQKGSLAEGWRKL